MRWARRAPFGSRRSASRRSQATRLSSSWRFPEPLPPLPAAVEVAAYRIAVEALLNVVRHAAAQRAKSGFRSVDDELEIDIVDDGQEQHRSSDRRRDAGDA